MTVTRTLAIRLAKTSRPRMPELPLGFRLVGSVPQALTPGPHSIVGTMRWVGTLNERHLSAAFKNSIVVTRQLGRSKPE